MIGLGTIVNVFAIIAGSVIGLLIGRRIPERVHTILIRGLGLFTIAIGIKMFIGTGHLLIVLISLLTGAAIGELINIERRLEGFGERIKSATKIDHQGFIDGFMTASLLYCIGPIAILGSMSDGMSGGHEILFIKSMLDGTASIGLAAGLGVGVLFAFVPVLFYQGILTIIAVLIGGFFSESSILELTAAGGLLMVGIGINLIGGFTEGRRIAVGNFLPAVLIAPLLTWLCQLLKVPF